MGVTALAVLFVIWLFYDVVHVFIKLVLIFTVVHPARHRHVIHVLLLLLVWRVNYIAQGPLWYRPVGVRGVWNDSLVTHDALQLIIVDGLHPLRLRSFSTPAANPVYWLFLHVNLRFRLLDPHIFVIAVLAHLLPLSMHFVTLLLNIFITSNLVKLHL